MPATTRIAMPAAMIAAALCVSAPSAPAAAADTSKCPPGYSWRKPVGCVQTNCNEIPHAHWSSTGECVCGSSGSIKEDPRDPNQECILPRDDPSCPACVYACVALGATCPDRSAPLGAGAEPHTQNPAGDRGYLERVLDWIRSGEPPPPPSRQSYVGDFSFVDGEVYIAHGQAESADGGPWVRATRGAKILYGDRIRVGPRSKGILVFYNRPYLHGEPQEGDAARLTLAPDSRLHVWRYVDRVYEAHEELPLLEVTKGWARRVSQALFGYDRWRVCVRTKSSGCGVRGTDFVLHHDAETDTDRLLVHDGEVEIAGLVEGRAVVGPGQQVTVHGGRVGPVTPLPHEEWSRIVAERFGEDGRIGPAAGAEEVPGEIRTGVTTGSGADPRVACEAYAAQAVRDQEENVRLGCRQSGPRWSTDYAGHLEWCLRAPSVGRDAEMRGRYDALRRCRGETSVGHASNHAFCDGYATTAVEQSRTNRERGCGGAGGNWQPSYRAHYDWCMRVRESDAVNAGRGRNAFLARCAGQEARHQICDRYALDALEGQRENLWRRCGYSGPLWAPDFQRHYEWCMTASPGSELDTEHGRTAALAACRAAQGAR
jgi:hypothetical protein